MAENDEKIQQARDLKEKAENLKIQTKELNAKGLKTEALAKMREFKEAQAQFDQFIEENPDILAEMYIDDDEKPKGNVSAPKVEKAK
jgi:transcription elongation GreA/GreB family factor